MTKEQFKDWVGETFPDNIIRAIAENDVRDGLGKMADYIFDTLNAVNTTVATYQDAVPLFSGDVFRTINVISDAVHNLDEEPGSPTFGQGLPSFYTYNPAMPAGKKVSFMGLDPDYLTSI